MNERMERITVVVSRRRGRARRYGLFVLGLGRMGGAVEKRERSLRLVTAGAGGLQAGNNSGQIKITQVRIERYHSYKGKTTSR
jgi:hypothetical protein